MNKFLKSAIFAAVSEGSTGGAAATFDPSAGVPAADAKPAAIVVPVGSKLASYFFKTPTLKDDAGNEIGKGKKHPDVKLPIPVPSREDVIGYLAAPDGTPEAKVRDLIMDQLFDALYAAGRRQINEFLEKNPEKQFSATDMDLSKLTLQAVADTPKGQRGAWAPSEEDLKEFNELYMTVLVHTLNYDPKKSKTHTDHWKAGMSKVKTNKPVLAKLREFLSLFASRVEEDAMEEVAQTYGWLVDRADKYLKAEEKDFLQAL